MQLNNPFPYNISKTIHALIGAALGALVLFIILFLEPFNSGNSNVEFKTMYFMAYGLITFFSYMALHLSSVPYYKKTKSWKLLEEVIFCFIFIIISIIITFYYTEIVINKKPERLNFSHFIGWFKAIFLGFGIIIFIPTILLRKQFTKADIKRKVETTKDILVSKKINLSSNLKKESFQVDENNLVYVKSENNYVRIYYFDENLLKEKLLRSSLTKIKKQLSVFIKIHRSYIVNPNFILSIKGNKQNAKLHLKKVENTIPISQPFFESVSILFNNLK